MRTSEDFKKGDKMGKIQSAISFRIKWGGGRQYTAIASTCSHTNSPFTKDGLPQRTHRDALPSAGAGEL